MLVEYTVFEGYFSHSIITHQLAQRRNVFTRVLRGPFANVQIVSPMYESLPWAVYMSGLWSIYWGLWQ
jgi:hypothetical protein